MLVERRDIMTGKAEMYITTIKRNCSAGAM